MTSAAPFTPATLRRIKEGACAADLGWDDDRYLRVCRDHGLSPVRAKPAPVAAPLPTHDGLTWDVSIGRVTCSGACIDIVGENRIAVFSALFRAAGKSAGHLDSYELSLAARQSIKGVGNSAHALRKLLAPLGWTIEMQRKVPDNGYRLVRLTS